MVCGAVLIDIYSLSKVVYTYIELYIYIYIYTNTYIYIIYIYIYVYKYAYLCMCKYTFIHSDANPICVDDVIIHGTEDLELAMIRVGNAMDFTMNRR